MHDDSFGEKYAEYDKKIAEIEHTVTILLEIIKQQNSAIENYKKANNELVKLKNDIQGFENIVQMYFTTD